MVSALDSASGGPGSSPGRGHCIVFLGKRLYSHSASLHPGVQMGTSKCAGGNPAMDSWPLHAKKTGVKHPPRHLGPYKGFLFPINIVKMKQGHSVFLT